MILGRTHFSRGLIEWNIFPTRRLIRLCKRRPWVAGTPDRNVNERCLSSSMYNRLTALQLAAFSAGQTPTVLSHQPLTLLCGCVMSWENPCLPLVINKHFCLTPARRVAHWQPRRIFAASWMREVVQGCRCRADGLRWSTAWPLFIMAAHWSSRPLSTLDWLCLTVAPM